MMTIVWTIPLILLIIGAIIYYYVTRIETQLLPSTNRLQKEVFIVKVFGSNLLGKGLLTAPYNYATRTQINNAIKAGLRCTVKTGDWILYTESNATIANMLPYGMIATGIEFSNSDDIVFIKSSQPTDVSGIYWVCLYGYKPQPQYDQWYRLFAWDQQFPIIQSNYYGIQSFNSSLWNEPQNSSSIPSLGNEVFWISVDNYNPTKPIDMNNALVGFKTATTDQYFWSYASGLGDGWIQTATAVSALDSTGVFQTFASNTTAPSQYGGLFQCINCQTNPTYNTFKPGKVMFAIWGNKAKAVKNPQFLTGFNITVYDFNSVKASQY